MTPPPIEPLDPATWFARVEGLLRTAEQLDGEGHDRVIRIAFHLVTLAPAPLRDLFPREIDEEAFEAMLDCGGYESAVMALVGPEVAFKAERAAHSVTIEVTMALQPHSINGKGRHETCAMAMLKAWARCLVNFGKTARALNRADQAPRISPAGLHPSSTEH